jgi:hypothetical protein
MAYRFWDIRYCWAGAVCLATLAGGTAYAGDSAVIDTEHGLSCNHQGGAWDGSQCRFPAAPSPAARGPSGNSQQNFNRGRNNFNNALGAFGAAEQQDEQDRENAAEQQRQEQAARDAAEAQRHAAEAAADAKRRASLSNPFDGGQPAPASDNPFAAPSQGSGGAPVQQVNTNPFATNPFAAPAPAASHPPTETWTERPPRGTYEMTQDECYRWKGYFTFHPNTHTYQSGDDINYIPTGQCVIRTAPRQLNGKPSDDLGVRG